MAFFEFLDCVLVLLVHFFDGTVIIFSHCAAAFVDAIERIDGLEDAKGDSDNHNDGDKDNDDAMDGKNFTENSHGGSEIEGI